MNITCQDLRDYLDWHCLIGRGDWQVRVDPRTILCSSALCFYVAVEPPSPRYSVDQAEQTVFLRAVIEGQQKVVPSVADDDLIDLSEKRNRIILALDIFLGTLLFQQCYPTEPMSSYFWRTNHKWTGIVDRLLGKGHCRRSYQHSAAHLFDAPEYRV